VHIETKNQIKGKIKMNIINIKIAEVIIVAAIIK